MAPRRRDVIKGLGIAGATVAVGSNVASADPGRARVRAVHASPDAPNVDVFVDGAEALSDVPFNTVSAYLEVKPGNRRVRITPASDNSTAIFDDRLQVRPGKDYTIAVIGEVSEGTVSVEVLRDRNEFDQNSYSIARVVHAAPDAPAVDLRANRGFLLATDVEFGDVTSYSPNYGREVPVELLAGGSVVFEESIPFQGGTTYTIFVTGYASPGDEPGTDGLDYLVAGETSDDGDDGDGGTTPDTGRVRVAHASPDAPNVDVFVDGSKALSDVPFTAVSNYLSVPAGDRTVEITAAGDPSTVAFSGSVTVAADTDYTVAATGELSEGTFAPTVLVDDFELGAGQEGAVRVLHASPDAGAVDVTAEDGAASLFDGLSFGDVSNYATLPSARGVDVEVRPDAADDDNPFDAEFTDLDLTGVNTAIATGYFTAIDEPTDEQFTLVLARGSGD